MMKIFDEEFEGKYKGLQNQYTTDVEGSKVLTDNKERGLGFLFWFSLWKEDTCLTRELWREDEEAQLKLETDKNMPR